MNTIIRATLLRTETGDQGTFGELTTDTGLSLVTGELPWRDNLTGLSCIPAGEYIATIAWSERFQRSLYRLQSVPNREAILLHNGNYCGDTWKGWRSDVEGCILLGSHLGVGDKNQKIVSMSRWALDALHANAQNREIVLSIKEEFGV